MSFGRIAPNEEVLIDGQLCRICRKLPQRRWEFESLSTLEAFALTVKEIEQKLGSGGLRFPGKFEHRRDLRPETILTADQKNAVLTRLPYVKAVEGQAYNPAKWKPVIESVWMATGKPCKCPAASTVAVWVSKVRSHGGDPLCLIEHHAAKGNRKSRIQAEVRSISEGAIETCYLVRTGGTIQAAVDRARHLVFEENKFRAEHDQLIPPSFTFMRKLAKRLPAKRVHAAQHGPEASRKAYRGVLKHVDAEAPLERVQIDHTQLDIIVLDDNTGLVLGRPTLTACIDVYTRCVLGIHIGFEQPSFYKVAKCLEHCIRPKADLQDRYPGIKTPWAPYGIMTNLVVDNGLEFHCDALEQACWQLKIIVEYCPRETPWYKANIERFFGTLNAELHRLPGTTFSNTAKKGDYNPVRHAQLSYSALKEFVFTWISDIYHNTTHRGIGTAPMSRWLSSIDIEDIRVPADDIHLDAVLCRREKRRVDHKGVTFDYLHYNSEELIACRNQLGSVLSDVDVRVDVEDLGHIWVSVPQWGPLFKVPCLQQNYAKGLSLELHQILKRHTAESGKGVNENELLAMRAELLAKVEASTLKANRNKQLGAKAGRFFDGLKSQNLITTPVRKEALNPVGDSVHSLPQLGHNEDEGEDFPTFTPIRKPWVNV